jgi:hypothetical protein
MSQLQKLYQIIQNSKELGLQLPAETIARANEMEEQIITQEILPALEKEVSPILNQIQRELVLELVYVPDEPLSVRLLRNTEWTQQHSTKMEDVDPPKSPERRTFTIAPHTKGKRTGLRVHFPDGTVLSEYYAAQTLAEVIRKIGPEKVRPLNLAANGVPLVSDVRDDFYNQHDLGDGTLIMTHTSTRVKKDLLDEVSKRLDLGLKVEII